MTLEADVLAPVKTLRRAKSRLRAGLGGDGPDADREHEELALAFVRDTLAAAAEAAHVRRVVAICSDDVAARVLRGDGVLVIPDEPGGTAGTDRGGLGGAHRDDGLGGGPHPDGGPGGGPHRHGGPGGGGLDAALRHGAAVLRAWDPGAVVVALQADLPALRPADLDTALGWLAASGVARAFCADHTTTGTTLLAARPPAPLGPRFGVGSAAAHAASGAVAIPGALPSLRLDVDTPADLDAARALGLGPRTTAVLAARARHR